MWTRRVQKGQALRLFPGVFIDTEIWDGAKPWEKFRLMSIAGGLRYPKRFLTLEAAASVLGISMATVSNRIVLGSGTSKMYQRLVNPQTKMDLLLCRREVPIGEVIIHDGIAVTSPAWTTMALLSTCTKDMGLRIPLTLIEGALRLGVTKDELWERAAMSGGRIGTGPWAEECLRLASDRSDSAAETFMRVILLEAGIDFVQQAHIYRPVEGNVSKVGRVDFLLPEYSIVIEVDGSGKYGEKEREQRLSVLAENDREKQIRNQGYPVLRVGWADMMSGEALRLIQLEIESTKARPRRHIHGHWERAELYIHDDGRGKRQRDWFI